MSYLLSSLVASLIVLTSHCLSSVVCLVVLDVLPAVFSCRLPVRLDITTSDVYLFLFQNVPPVVPPLPSPFLSLSSRHHIAFCLVCALFLFQSVVRAILVVPLVVFTLHCPSPNVYICFPFQNVPHAVPTVFPGRLLARRPDNTLPSAHRRRHTRHFRRARPRLAAGQRDGEA